MVQTLTDSRISVIWLFKREIWGSFSECGVCLGFFLGGSIFGSGSSAGKLFETCVSSDLEVEADDAENNDDAGVDEAASNEGVDVTADVSTL